MLTLGMEWAFIFLGFGWAGDVGVCGLVWFLFWVIIDIKGPFVFVT